MASSSHEYTPVHTGITVPASHTDGVFSNLSAKPTAPSALDSSQNGSSADEGTALTANGTTGNNPLQNPPDAPPPSYYDVVPPPSFATAVDTSHLFVDEDGEILIDGLPMGNFFILMVNLFISVAFDFIGFLLTSLLANSHSARAGSRIGLGLTLMRYGLLIGTKGLDDDSLDSPAPPDYHRGMSQDKIRAQREWMAYFLSFVGFLVLMHADAEYIRVYRLFRLLKNTSLAELQT